MRATIHVDGRSVQAEFSDCILHVSGEFGGNLDFSVKLSEPVSTEKVLQNLRLKLPKTERLIDVLGYSEIVGGLEINMESELAPPGEDIPASAVPPNVDVFWLEKNRNFLVGSLRVNAQAGADDKQQEEGAVPHILDTRRRHWMRNDRICHPHRDANFRCRDGAFVTLLSGQLLIRLILAVLIRQPIGSAASIY
jgi:hypothetical protein